MVDHSKLGLVLQIDSSFLLHRTIGFLMMLNFNLGSPPFRPSAGGFHPPASPNINPVESIPYYNSPYFTLRALQA